MQSALQRFRRGEKGIEFMEVEYLEIIPIMKITLSTMAVFMGKEIMHDSKKSCYRIPIHYDPEL